MNIIYFNRLKVLCMFLLLIAATSFSVHAGKALDDLKKPLDAALLLFTGDEFNSEDKVKAQKEKFLQLIRDTFDYSEVAIRALGKNRKVFSDKEFSEFRDVFAEFLILTYVNKLDFHYENLSIEYLSEDYKGTNKAIIKTLIKKDDMEFPVDYAMISKKNGWKIYDLAIEGVRFMSNYRKQYTRFLSKKTPADLISVIKKKTDNMKQGSNEES